MAIYIQTEFIGSFPKESLCPKDGKPEYAFIGRSNVGKSSLINRLANQKELAKTSSKPGKTQMLNYFEVDASWYLVDLPGYGYAKVSKTVKEKFQKLIRQYIVGREQLIQLFVLLDSRHPPQKIDLEFMTWLGESGVPFAMVFTKRDKVKATHFSENLEAYKEKMLEVWEELPPVFVTSSQTGEGKEEILTHIQSVNDSL